MREPSSSDWADFSTEVRRDLVSRACHVLFVCYQFCLFGQLLASCQLLLQSFIFISKTLPPPPPPLKLSPPRQYLGLKVRFIGGWDWPCVSVQSTYSIYQNKQITDQRRYRIQKRHVDMISSLQISISTNNNESTYIIIFLNIDFHLIFYFSPGIFFVMPCIETYQKVDLRTITLGVPPQEVELFTL